jgi:hypothetical protein
MRKTVIASGFKPKGKFDYECNLSPKDLVKPYYTKISKTDNFIFYKCARTKIMIDNFYLKGLVDNRLSGIKSVEEEPIGVKVLDASKVIFIFPEMIELELGIVVKTSFAEQVLYPKKLNVTLEDISVLPLLRKWKSFNPGTGQPFIGVVPEQFRKGSGVIYRGISISKKLYAELKAGNPIKLKSGIVSFSLDKTVSKNFVNPVDGPGIIFKKKVDPKCIVLNIGDYCAAIGSKEEYFGLVGDEKEIIIKQNDYYRTVEPTEVVYFNGGGK